MKKLIVALFLTILGSPVFGETLFYKQSGASITPEEHEVLYPILLETQFPTSLAFGSYVDNEQAVMNQRIKAKLPGSGIEATFIPTTLYELFALNYVKDNFDNFEKVGRNQYGRDVFYVIVHEGYKPKLSSEIAESITPLKLFKDFHDFKTINTDPRIKKLHLAVNNYILENLKKNGLPIPTKLQDSLSILNTIDFWKPFGGVGDVLKIAHGGKSLLDKDDMKRAIEVEYKALHENKFPIYRGANVLDDESIQRISEGAQQSQLNRSISYGTTLLGGVLFDPYATAYYYMSPMTERPVGYAVLIDKKQYAQGPLNNMFAIPTFISLVDLIAFGEFFHTRTKTPDPLNEKVGEGWAYENMSIIPRDKRDTLIPYYRIVASTPEQAQEVYKSTLRYIRDNHIIIKKK